MSQVFTETVSVEVVTISIENDTTDRISLKLVDPGPFPMPGGGFPTFTCPRGTYKTGDQFTRTQTVDTV